MTLREFLRDENGNSLVSLVICSVPLIYIFAMIVSYGQAFYGMQVAANAAATGARAAAIHSNAGGAYTSANQIASTYVNSVGMGVTFEADELKYTNWKRKGQLEYCVTVKVRTAMPMNPFGEGIKESFSLTRSCPAIIEGE